MSLAPADIILTSGRFKLLNCGMSLLQGDVLPKSLAKHVLRQRIYSCALDFFCGDKMYPVKDDTNLKEDLQVLVLLIVLFIFVLIFSDLVFLCRPFPLP